MTRTIEQSRWGFSAVEGGREIGVYDTQEQAAATGQVWRMYAANGEATDFSGPDLCRRAVSRGWANYQFFADSSVGTTLKTGVSAYERIV